MQRKMQRWIATRWTGSFEIFLGIWAVELVALVIMCLFIALFHAAHLMDVEHGSGREVVRILRGMSAWQRLWTLVSVTLIEEVVFRAIVLAPVLRHFHPDRRGVWPLVAAVTLSSVTFGYFHGEWVNIFIQGVNGMGLAIIFLKSGGWQKEFWKPLFVAWMAHLGFDLAVTGSMFV